MTVLVPMSISPAIISHAPNTFEGGRGLEKQMESKKTAFHNLIGESNTGKMQLEIIWGQIRADLECYAKEFTFYLSSTQNSSEKHLLSPHCISYISYPGEWQKWGLTSSTRSSK